MTITVRKLDNVDEAVARLCTITVGLLIANDMDEALSTTSLVVKADSDWRLMTALLIAASPITDMVSSEEGELLAENLAAAYVKQVVSYGDAAKLAELHILHKQACDDAFDARVLQNGFDPANLGIDEIDDVYGELENWDVDSEDFKDHTVTLHLKRWHELHKQIYDIEAKYQAQSIAIGSKLKKEATND